VIEASSVEEASKLVSLQGLTHVISDLAIGESGTGIEVAQLVPDGLPILIITGLPPGDVLRTKAEEVYSVLSKPFDFDTLLNALVKVESS